MKETVAILGASENPDRYSYLAFKMLLQYGHNPVPVSPKLKTLEGVTAFASLAEIGFKVDTLTMYVGAETSNKLKDQILNLKPGRVIFNPGSENRELAEALEKSGIEVEEACTLVLLKSHQF